MRRWVVAGMSARSMAMAASSTLMAWARSAVSATRVRLSLRPRVMPTYRPAAAGRGRGEGDGAIGGVALGAVFGAGVSELHVVADVVGGQGDRAVSADAGHGDLAGIGSVWVMVQRSRLRTGSPVVVRSCRSLRRVTTTSPTIAQSSSMRVAVVGSSSSVVESVLLDAGVDRGDVFVAGGHDRQRLARIPALASTCQRSCRGGRRSCRRGCGRARRRCRVLWGRRLGGGGWWRLPRRG